jgi:hypothetical protein
LSLASRAGVANGVPRRLASRYRTGATRPIVILHFLDRHDFGRLHAIEPLPVFFRIG